MFCLCWNGVFLTWGASTIRRCWSPFRLYECLGEGHTCSVVIIYLFWAWGFYWIRIFFGHIKLIRFYNYFFIHFDADGGFSMSPIFQFFSDVSNSDIMHKFVEHLNNNPSLMQEFLCIPTVRRILKCMCESYKSLKKQVSKISVIIASV